MGVDVDVDVDADGTSGPLKMSALMHGIAWHGMAHGYVCSCFNVDHLVPRLRLSRLLGKRRTDGRPERK